MKELRQETKSDLSRALYGLWREAENENFSLLFPIIESAVILVKKGKDFANFQEAMKEINLQIQTSTNSDFSEWVNQTHLDDKNDEDYAMREETNQDTLAWLQEF